jgi:hypothetical protein
LHSSVRHSPLRALAEFVLWACGLLIAFLFQPYGETAGVLVRGVLVGTLAVLLLRHGRLLAELQGWLVGKALGDRVGNATRRVMHFWYRVMAVFAIAAVLVLFLIAALRAVL